MGSESMGPETRFLDATGRLDPPEAQSEYLSATFGTDDGAYVIEAPGKLARVRGMTATAKGGEATGQVLHTVLSSRGDLRLSTLLGTSEMFILRIAAQPMT